MIKKILKSAFLFLIMIAVLSSVFISSCTKSSPEFAAVNDLADKTIEIINNGDSKALLKLIIQRDDFIQNYYRHLPEAKQRNALSGKDFYKYFMGLQKMDAVRRKIKQYKGRIVTIKSVGVTEKIIETDVFKIYRNIPITLIVRDNNGNNVEIVDDKILGVVVEQNNRYRLLNILK